GGARTARRPSERPPPASSPTVLQACTQLVQERLLRSSSPWPGPEGSRPWPLALRVDLARRAGGRRLPVCCRSGVTLHVHPLPGRPEGVEGPRPSPEKEHVRLARSRGAPPHRRLVARGHLPHGGPDLPARKPAAPGAAAARARQAAPAGPLGDEPRPQPPLRAREPADPPRPLPRHLPRRPGTRWTCRRRLHLSRGHLQRDLPAGDDRRGRDAAPLPPVLHAG